MNEIEQLKGELEQAKKACAELREALLPFACETCAGTHTFTFECPGCLTGEGECTCDKQQPEPCPQCQQEGPLKQIYAKREHALSTSCGHGYYSREQVMPLVNELRDIHEWIESAEKEYLESIDISHGKMCCEQALAHAKAIGIIEETKL